MPRGKANRGRGRDRGRGRGRGGGREGNPNTGSQSSKRGGGYDHYQSQHQQHQNMPSWTFRQEHYHGDAAPDLGTDSPDCEYVKPGQFPAAKNNRFYNPFPTSSIPQEMPPCLRDDCKRAKKGINSIRERDRQLHRALECGIEQLAKDMVHSLGKNIECLDDDYDVEPMGWTPEPTVNLIVALVSSSGPPSPTHVDLGIHCDASPPPPPRQFLRHQQ